MIGECATQSARGWQALSRTQRYLLVVAWLVAAFLALFKLEYYPRTWFDEGENLQVPKNLVLYGQYALRSSEGFRVLDPALTTGPTVLLPIGLAFKAAGIGMLPARLVMAAYLLLAITVFYQLTNSLYGQRAALIALWLLVGFAGASPNNVFYLGRMVMGDVPALFFFLAGALVWMKALSACGRRQMSRLAVSGLLMGLAMVTKNQYALVIPSMVVLWAADRLYYKRLDWTCFVVPVVVGAACLLAWYATRFAILGPGAFADNLTDMRAVTATSVAVFSPRKMLGNMARLARSGFLLLGAPSLAYTLRSPADEELGALKRGLLLVFITLWLAWYVFASVGWKRYYFAPLAVTLCFVGEFLSDLTRGFGQDLHRLWTKLKQKKAMLPPVSIWAMVGLLIAVLHPLQQTAKALILADDRTPQEVALSLEERVPADMLVETWEWELGFFTDFKFHFPPTSVLNAKTLAGSFGVPFPADGYDFREHEPAFLVSGPFSKSTGLYPDELLKEKCTLVESVGGYDLYDLRGCRQALGWMR